MGTAIVPVALALLPFTDGALHDLAIAMWVLAVGLLGALALGALLRPDRDAALAPYLGAPPMALMAVGAATELVGRSVIGTHPALIADGVLWTLGAASGAAVALAVPLRPKPDGVDATWLLSIVPPIVAAATGAALIPHVPDGAPRLALHIVCWAMWAFGLVASLVAIALIARRLVERGPGPPALVPTLFIVLGPLGQSVTAVNLLAPDGTGRWLFDVPVLGFALFWLGLSTVLLVRTARRGLPFTLAWWSLTFPVGTCATGAATLAGGSEGLRALAYVLMAMLAAGWLAAALGTVSWLLPRRPPHDVASNLG